MKKLISFFVLVSIISCSTIPPSKSVEEVDPGFVILDVLLYRPVGFAVTIIGTGAFIGLSPLTALASIPEPHDAFAKTAKILILAPGAYTFIRPLGDRAVPFHVPRYKYKPVATPNNVETYNMTVTPAQHPVTPAVPDVKPLQGYPYTGKGL
ncbi:MAG: hypothetical protein LUQ68_08135 [Methylococcaceae bacterium]|nr:hypothetical protein [Methylococcaceae bacterium]OYV22111.1 MAG: hypothetical protein CG442_1521 [Methylococcaceae bacterium NSO1]